MEQVLNQMAELFFVGPVWPASILVCLMMIYATIAMFGLADLGLDADVDFDIDVDIDVDLPMEVSTPDLEAGDFAVSDGDVDVSAVSGAGLLGSLGALTVRCTNFGRVPIAIWGGVFTLALWSISYVLWHNFDSERYAPVLLPSLLLTMRNSVLAVMVTKAITQPLVGRFAPQPGYDTRRLLGCTCEISTTEATSAFGQAKFRTNAAPLLLNVRTDGPSIPKGTEVKIVGFNPGKRVYTVTCIQPENEL